MKAQFVYETLDFERGQDPKKAMDLGLINADISNYTEKELINYIINVLPLLFKDYSEIIAVQPNEFINYIAATKIDDFLRNKDVNLAILDVNLYEVIQNHLMSLGYNFPSK